MVTKYFVSAGGGGDNANSGLSASPQATAASRMAELTAQASSRDLTGASRRRAVNATLHQSIEDQIGSTLSGFSPQKWVRFDHFLSDYYRRQFGLASLASRHIRTLLRCVKGYSKSNRQVALFRKFIDRSLSADQLAFFLAVRVQRTMSHAACV